MRHGALQYYECVADDLEPMPGMPRTSGFKKMTRLRPSETVWYSFIVYKSKAHRNAVSKAVMKEMEKYKDKMPKEMPFDMKRMAYGGFKTVVQG